MICDIATSPSVRARRMSFLELCKVEIFFIFFALGFFLRFVAELMTSWLILRYFIIKILFHYADFFGIMNLGMVNAPSFGGPPRAF